VTTVDVPHDLPIVPEDRQPALRLITRGAERADDHEIADNPRAASVRLRAVERIRPTDLQGKGAA
jgi:16S rRNA (cytosine1402-N4)-methyltransferase